MHELILNVPKQSQNLDKRGFSCINIAYNDVYIFNLETGYYGSVQGESYSQNNSMINRGDNENSLDIKENSAMVTFMAIRNDYSSFTGNINEILQATISHEFFHAIQYGYGDLEDSEMNDLYNYPKVKAHVTFTHGEGFGRPLLEATLSQKPVIASGWSGHVDFLHKDKSLLLPGELTDVHASAQWDKVILKGSKWFTVNYQETSTVMKDVYKNYRKYTRDNTEIPKISPAAGYDY